MGKTIAKVRADREQARIDEEKLIDLITIVEPLMDKYQTNTGKRPPRGEVIEFLEHLVQVSKGFDINGVQAEFGVDSYINEVDESFQTNYNNHLDDARVMLGIADNKVQLDTKRVRKGTRLPLELISPLKALLDVATYSEHVAGTQGYDCHRMSPGEESFA
jgi:hypothetical protein